MIGFFCHTSTEYTNQLYTSNLILLTSTYLQLERSYLKKILFTSLAVCTVGLQFTTHCELQIISLDPRLPSIFHGLDPLEQWNIYFYDNRIFSLRVPNEIQSERRLNIWAFFRQARPNIICWLVREAFSLDFFSWRDFHHAENPFLLPCDTVRKETLLL